MVVKVQRCSQQGTGERKEPTVILAAWCMIWQIDAAVADVSFWGMYFTTQKVKLAAARFVQKRENNSSFLHNIISPMSAVVRAALKGKINRRDAKCAKTVLMVGRGKAMLLMHFAANVSVCSVYSRSPEHA